MKKMFSLILINFSIYSLALIASTKKIASIPLENVRVKLGGFLSTPLLESNRPIVAKLHVTKKFFQIQRVDMEVVDPGDYQDLIGHVSFLLSAYKTRYGYRIVGKNCKNFQWEVSKKGSRSRNLVYLTEKSRKDFKFIVSRSGVPIETRVSFLDPKTGVDCTLNSIKPNWRSDLDQYTLDLDGLAEVASIRNFIINNGKGQEAYLSGKLSDKTLQIRFSHPFSPVQAFAIALATL